MRYLILASLLGCASEPHDYLVVDLSSPTVRLHGAQIESIAVDATISGPVQTGGAIKPSGAIDMPDFTEVDSMSLTTGDQEWVDGAILHVVDTRTDAPWATFAGCGATVVLQVTVAGPMADDGHLEGSTNAIDTPIVCD